jgi:D-sedoheptulose 7-phosphate isomerase
MKKNLLYSIAESIRAITVLSEPHAEEFMENCANMIVNCYREGGKLIIAGNGGSLCDAMHFAEEMTGQFRKPRKALPAIALSDPGHLTCVSNDLGFEHVFSRGVEAFGKPGDLFIGLSTSGNSENIIRAFATAKELGLETIAFLGKNGGMVKGAADLELLIGGFQTSDRVQEVHMAAIHIIIELVEIQLFSESPDLASSR